MSAEDERLQAERFVAAVEKLVPLLQRLTVAFENMAVSLHILAGVRSGSGLPL